MHQTGVDLFYDVHGDEGLPYVFLAGCEGVPSYNDKMAQLQQQFLSALTIASADFQTEFGYDKDEPGKANLTVGSNWVANTFSCLADPFVGWSPERCVYLGEASLVAMLAVVDNL